MNYNFFLVMIIHDEVTAQSLSKMMLLFLLAAGNRGFSIGIGDVTPGRGLIREKELLVDNGWVCVEGEDISRNIPVSFVKNAIGTAQKNIMKGCIVNQF